MSGIIGMTEVTLNGDLNMAMEAASLKTTWT